MKISEGLAQLIELGHQYGERVEYTRSVLKVDLDYSTSHGSVVEPLTHVTDSRRLGRVALPVPSAVPGAEPKVFTVEVPPMSHLLGVTQEGGNVYLHFWFWDGSTRIVKQPRGVKFLPCEKLTLLWWFGGERYSGPLGIFLHTIPMNGITSHLFDMTDYNHETGRIEA